MKLKCEVISDLIPLYYDGVCSQESRKLVEEHLLECSDCRQELEDLGKEFMSTPNEDQVVENLAKRWKKDRFQSFLYGTIIVSILGAIASKIAFNQIGSYVAEDGLLVEPFALIPLFFLFVLIAVVASFVLITKMLINKIRK